MADLVTNNQHTVQEVHQPEPGNADQGNPLLTLDPGMVIWTWVIFFVFLFVLRRYAWKPILDSLDERETSIKKAVDDAEAARLSIEAASEEQRKLIDEGNRKASDIISEARDAAAQSAEETRKRAREESEELIADAQIQINQEMATAVSELMSEAGNLSIMVASKLLGTDLDDDQNRERAKDHIAALLD
jgi:F-type H+-transporting ATPase subunit b